MQAINNITYNIPFYIYIFLFTSFMYGNTNTTINGFVRDSASGEPISYANVFLANTALGAATNQDGYFVITNVPTGSYEINVSMMGYGLFKENITQLDGNPVRIEIFLTEKVIETEEILVTAERQKFEKTVESSQISLDLREIKAAPAFIEPDVFRTLQMLPGVQTSSDYSSALYVRGSTPDQNLIMQDGIAIYNPYHLGGIFSTFNTDAIKEADFHAGGFPARYGGRMGAILNVVNREGNIQKVTGSADISLISSKGLIEGPLPKWKGMKGSWMISGRRTYFDKIVDALEIPMGKNNDGSQSYFVFPYYFYDYQIKINLDINPNHRLTYSRFYGDDVLNFSFNENTEQVSNDGVVINQESSFDINWPWGNQTNGLTWRWIVTPTVVAKTFISNSRYRFDFRFGYKDKYTFDYVDSTNIYSSDIVFNVFDIIDDNTLESEVIWQASENQEITGGIQIKNIDFDLGLNINFSDQDTTIVFNPLQLKNMTRESAFFLQNKWDFKEDFKFQFGLRGTHYNLHNKIYFDPRLGAKYTISENFALKGNWGVYHQFLTTANGLDDNLRLVELWLGIPEDKEASVSNHLITGVEYLANNNIFFRAELYHKSFDNLLTLKQGNNTENDNQETQTPFNEFWDTDANSIGIELLIKKASGRFRGWIGYTFSETEYFNEPSGWHPPNFDRTHTLNLVSTFDLTKTLEISSAVTFSSGNPYTPILGKVYDWNQNLNSETYWYPYENYLVGNKNTARYDEYFRFDIGLTRKGGNLFGLRYDTFWQIMNATKHLNQLGYVYRSKRDIETGNQVGVERRPLPMFPLILTFGIKFEF